MNEGQSPIPRDNNHSPNSKPEEEKVVHRSLTVSESFSGPIPSPTTLAAYERILPGLADRIMKMAESQSEHRKGLETKVILHDRIRSMLGLVFAFLIVIIAFLIGGYLVLQGKSTSGLVSAFVPLAVIVGAFIYQKREKKEE